MNIKQYIQNLDTNKERDEQIIRVMHAGINSISRSCTPVLDLKLWTMDDYHNIIPCPMVGNGTVINNILDFSEFLLSHKMFGNTKKIENTKFYRSFFLLYNAIINAHDIHWTNQQFATLLIDKTSDNILISNLSQIVKMLLISDSIKSLINNH